jgi:hypothetical protein
LFLPRNIKYVTSYNTKVVEKRLVFSTTCLENNAVLVLLYIPHNISIHSSVLCILLGIKFDLLTLVRIPNVLGLRQCTLVHIVVDAWSNISASIFTGHLKVEAVSNIESLTTTYQITWCRNLNTAI